MSYLKIYHSSAGSGKTTKLTEEYLKLLFTNQENYRHILAVTFTNKAANEMKDRIIAELYELSRQLDDSNYSSTTKNLINTLKQGTDLTEKEISEKARLILQNILHNYSFFSVSTIDSFFQKIIRGFAKETGLQAGYNIELDENKVLNEATDKIMLEIGINKELTKWLIRFAEEKINEGKSWDFKKDIFNLGKELFKERFKGFNILKDYEKKTLDEIYKQLLQKKYNFYKFKEQIIKKYGDVWTKSNRINKKKLNNISPDDLDKINKKIKSFESVSAVLSNFHSLGILVDLYEKIKDYRDKNNVFLISDSAEFIKEIIKDTDAYFIYEKLGTTFKHFMIDEFQDTSDFQWENFKPLILNSLAQKHHNLIVGDIKQSIYRWRNSKWELLYNQIENDIKPFKITKEVLNKNWRSKENIILFNNAFFKEISSLLQNKFNKDLPKDLSVANEYFHKNIITSVYQEIEQKISKETEQGGHVYMEFIESAQDDNSLDWKEKVKSKIINIIKEDLKNISLKDIAILVRRNSEAEEISSHLLENEIDVISKEALFLKNSSSVRLLLNALRYLDDPKNKINNAEFICNLTKISCKTNITPFKFFNPFEVASNSFDDFLKSAFKEFDEKQNIVKKLPLYECVETLIDIFSLNQFKEEFPYIHSFQDIILEYSKTESPDIASFLDWWEEFGVKKTVKISELQEAVRIMTIHQAKGLEFKVIIIPFCNWNFDHQRTDEIIWCRTNEHEQPFDKIRSLPLKYKNDLKDTIFAEDYFNEKLHAYIDNLNLLYVAFTRAKESLYVFSELPDLSKKKNKISYPLFEVLNNYQSQFSSLPDYSWDGKILKIGKLILSAKDTETVNEKIHKIKLKEYIINSDVSKQLTIYSQSKDFFISQPIKEKINYGKLMHEILAKIDTAEDIEQSVNSFIFNGKLSQQQADEIKQKLIEIVNHHEISDWFTKKWKIIKEHPILLANGKIKIPDRVMIKDKNAIVLDFKFGEEEREEHKNQIKDYVECIKNMGYNVKGYLFYGNQKKLVTL